MTTADLITALRLAREVEAEQEAPRRRAADARADDPPAAREPDENVKPLALATARAAKKD
jgi:hypothetical protein